MTFEELAEKISKDRAVMEAPVMAHISEKASQQLLGQEVNMEQVIQASYKALILAAKHHLDEFYGHHE